MRDSVQIAEAVVLADVEGLALPPQEVERGPVRGRDAFGCAGGPRGEQDIGRRVRIAGGQRAWRHRVRRRLMRRFVAHRDDAGNIFGPVGRRPRPRDQQRVRPRHAHQHAQPLGRVFGIERHHRRPDPQHGQHGPDQRRAPFGKDRDARTRSQPRRDQPPRQQRRGAFELAIGDLAPLGDQRDTFRPPRRLIQKGVKQPARGHRGRDRDRQRGRRGQDLAQRQLRLGRHPRQRGQQII